MTRLRVAAGMVLVAVSFAWGLTGREVVEEAQRKNGFSTWKDRRASATMTTYAGEAVSRTRDLDITEQTDPRGEHRTFIAFTSPADVQGTRFLHLSPRGGSDQQWLYAPATRRVRRLGEAQRDENFFGADLSYRDLELVVRIQQWNDAESTATLEKDETVDGRPCRMVSLVPKNDEFPSYGRYLLAFGADDGLLWRVDLFDTDGRLYKRVSPRRYQRIGVYATAMEADVETLPANTHTRFVFREVAYDAGVADGVFVVSNLDH